VEPLGGEHVALDQAEERHEGESPVADLVGQRRHRQIDPLRRDNQDENSATIRMRMPPRGYRKKGVARL